MIAAKRGAQQNYSEGVPGRDNLGIPLLLISRELNLRGVDAPETIFQASNATGRNKGPSKDPDAVVLTTRYQATWILHLDKSPYVPVNS